VLTTLLILLVLVVVGAVLYALAPHPPATPKNVSDADELDTYLGRLVDSENPPGLSIVVVKDGQTAFSRAFGYSDKPRGAKVTPDTVFHWWSMTKIPTAIAIMQLQERGRIDLDEDVRKYLAWFEAIDSSGTRPSITIRNLLQHSSGLPDTMPGMIGWVHYDDAGRNQTEVLRAHLPRFNKLKFKPGAKAIYSNLNYMVLGAVIEAVSGQAYEEYMARNLLQPLGMSRTGFIYTAEMAEHEAAGTLPIVHFYTPILPALLDLRALVRERHGRILWLQRVYIDATPSTGLIGPAADVARLMTAYLNGGTLDGKAILHPDSVSLLTNTSPLDGHGLGWFVDDSSESRTLGHAGGGPGFASVMRLYPERKLGIAILANGTDLDRDRLLDLIAGMAW
jgi:CubicO group peptidase (beta-lactamase class C family)